MYQAVGMSNNLANYMTMALDPNVAHLVKFMNKNVPAYAQLLDQLQEELDIKLIKSKLSIVDLFHFVNCIPLFLGTKQRDNLFADIRSTFEDLLTFGIAKRQVLIEKSQPWSVIRSHIQLSNVSPL